MQCSRQAGYESIFVTEQQPGSIRNIARTCSYGLTLRRWLYVIATGDNLQVVLCVGLELKMLSM